MVAIVTTFSVDLESLSDPLRLPSVDDLRPSSCPSCSQPARPADSLMGIVGNGTYKRQVLGLAAAAEPLVILVRRYLCRGCRGSISVLPDALLPWRWYAGTAMILGLVLSLLRGQTEAQVRSQLAKPSQGGAWKTLHRWQHQLLAPLWDWMAAQIGFADHAPEPDQIQRAVRLRRLLALRGVHARNPNADIGQAACALATGTAHTRAKSWQIHRAR